MGNMLAYGDKIINSNIGIDNKWRYVTTTDEIATSGSVSISNDLPILLSDAHELLVIASYNQAFTYASQHHFVIDDSNIYYRSYHYINNNSSGPIQVRFDITNNAISLTNSINESTKFKIYIR